MIFPGDNLLCPVFLCRFHFLFSILRCISIVNKPWVEISLPFSLSSVVIQSGPGAACLFAVLITCLMFFSAKNKFSIYAVVLSRMSLRSFSIFLKKMHYETFHLFSQCSVELIFLIFGCLQIYNQLLFHQKLAPWCDHSFFLVLSNIYSRIGFHPVLHLKY